MPLLLVQHGSPAAAGGPLGPLVVGPQGLRDVHVAAQYCINTAIF